MIDLRADRGQWALVPTVYLLMALLISLPIALLSTFENPSFSAHLGVEPVDIRADIQFGDDAEAMIASKQQLTSLFEADPSIAAFRSFGITRYQIDSDEGTETQLVEVGDYAASPLKYIRGHAPTDGEIALSVLSADRYDASVGQVLTLTRGTETIERTVSGVYQDVTNGGFTAKMSGTPPVDSDRWVIYADTVLGASPTGVTEAYEGIVPSTSVVPVQQYMGQTLSYVTSALRAATIAMLAVGIASICLIATAFLRLRILKERRAIAIMSVLGFSRNEQVSQFQAKTLIGAVIGVGLGLLCTMTAGQAVVSSALSATGIGISHIHFLPNPWPLYIGIPLLLIATAVILSRVIARHFLSNNPIGWIR